jgi:antibiotic biosynthesis monooxygenase (ABM) superfamily enzyme
MANQTLYLTLLIFVKPGEEETFQAYEDKVLPLLQHYKGELLYRIRPDTKSIIHATEEQPYEIHLIRFASKTDFEHYKQDKERNIYSPLFRQSVTKVILLESYQ